MYLGLYKYRCEEGRIHIPARWIDPIGDELYNSSFPLFLGNTSISFWTRNMIDVFLKRIQQSSGPEYVHFRRQFLSSLFECVPDPRGRITVRKDRLQHSFGESSFGAVFIGQGEYFELWHNLDWFLFGSDILGDGSYLGDTFRTELDRMINSPGTKAPKVLEYKPKVFISYSSKDKGLVHRLAKILEGWGCQVLLDSWIIKPGDSLHASIGSAIANADVVLCCLSRAANESRWFQQELREVLAKRENESSDFVIIPCILESVEIPSFLRDYLYCNFDKDFQNALKKLAMSLRSRFRLDEFDQMLNRTNVINRLTY